MEFRKRHYLGGTLEAVRFMALERSQEISYCLYTVKWRTTFILKWSLVVLGRIHFERLLFYQNCLSWGVLCVLKLKYFWIIYDWESFDKW